MLASYLLLGETAAAPAFFGGLLILGGVYLVGLKDGRKRITEVSVNA